MRLQTLIFIVVLLTLNKIHSFEFSNLQEVKELRNSAYGNSLIETVNLSLNTNGSMEEVQKLLENLLYKINRNQEESDKSWEIEEKRLNTKVKEIDSHVEALRVQILHEKENLKNFKTLEESAKSNLQQYSNQKATDLLDLAELKSRREKDHAEYINSISDHNDIINAIDAVLFQLNQIETNLKGKEGIDSSTENLLKRSFMEITKNKAESEALVEIATSNDESALAQLITLLEKLKGSAKRSLNDDESNEQDSLKTYRKLLLSLETDIDKLDKIINDQHKNLLTYKENIANLDSKVEQLTNLHKSESNELQSTKNELNEKDNQYKAEKEQRQKERETITKLQEIVNKRMQSMSRFLKESKN